MELKEYKKDFYEFTKQTSALVRQFAFAGIAVIWLFKTDGNNHMIPDELVISLIFFVLTLVFDLLQYLIPSIIFWIFFRYHEKKNNGNTSVDVKSSSYFNIPGWLFYFSKIALLIVGYISILKFLIPKI